MAFIVVEMYQEECRVSDKYDHLALRSHLHSLGISLRSATEPIDDTSTGKLMEGVLAAFAQFDNDLRSDRHRPSATCGKSEPEMKVWWTTSGFHGTR